MQRRKCRGLINKKIFSIVMALLMLFSMGGWENIIANALDENNFTVNSVTIYKIYNRNRNLEIRRVLIIGSNIRDAEVGIKATGTGYQPLTNRTTNSQGILQFDLTDDQLGNSIMIEGYEIPLDEENMPTLSGVTRRVERATADPSGEITLQGSNLDQINNGDVTAKYEPLDSGLTSFTGTTADGSEFKMTNLKGDLGLQNIILEKKTQSNPIDFPNHSGVNVDVTITYNYQEQFRLVESIGNLDELKMFPNRGEKGDKVYFTAPELDAYDVFFLTDINGTDPYTNENKGKNKTFLPDSGDTKGEDVLTVEVPDIDVGEYYVVLTNAVEEDKDPMDEVNQVYVVKVNNGDPDSDEDKFYVIDGSSKAKIISIQPNSGPDSGQEVTISGEFLGTLNIPEFTPTDADDKPVVEDPELDTEQEELVITYSGGTYNSFDVTGVTRTINVTIGDKAKFATYKDETDKKHYNCSFTKDLDTIEVITPQINDAEDDPVKDVVAEIETTFEIDEDGDGTADSAIVIKERAELEDGYTYIPSKLTPDITEIVPEKIQVEANETDYEVADDILIGIYGENFAVHKYDDGSGNEKVMYPQIEIGEVVLNKSFSTETDYDPNVDIRIFNDSGEELDGTEGNEIGTKILVTIPKGTTVTTLGKTFVKITNPVRNSENMGLSVQKNNVVEFVLPSANKIPVINDVEPNVVTVEGGEEVEITGSNFQAGVMVSIDGAKVEKINRSEDGKSITFTSPGGREGETQLLVMNEEGGMDTFPFTYVKTYTNPKISDFSPKEGNTGTLVVVNGDNFLLPDPTADEDSILKLIGTRILLEGEDINTYNLDTATKKIKLQDYTASGDAKKVLTISSGALKLEDYYHSILLHNESDDVFYTIEVDVKGNPYITNGVDEEYKLSVDGSNIKADKVGGSTFTLSLETDATGDYFELDGKTLRIKTPFKVENNVITGDNVKVVDKNTIYFTVPILQTDGYYDLTVVNPDTKKDIKKDEKGFYYFKQPQSKPKIENIEPGQGSTKGGYTISISGSEFEDNGSSKTKVIINGVEVDTEDIEVNTDGTKITVIVPPYDGDLSEDLNTDRITVPVVVVNPDGGSNSKENGFTYVIPSSNPEITKILPQNGSAAGGDIVEITGSDFRYFEPFDDEDRDQAWDYDDLNGNGKWDSNEAHEAFEDINGDGIWNNEEQIKNGYDWTAPKDFDHETYDQYFSSPILPKVYFGDEQAKIVEFSTGYLKVILPASKADAVDVYIVNNDSGISNSVEFAYDSSNPVIDTVIPDEGKKQGDDEIEINGEKFVKSYIKVYQQDSVGSLIWKNLSIVLVNFGRITNKNIERDEENSGLINNSRTTVNLDGGFKIEYDGSNDKLKVAIEEYNITYQREITSYDDSEVYIDVSILKDSEGNSYDGHELIRVWVEDRRLFVERGYAPKVDYKNSEQIIVHTPSYYTVGTVPLFVINPDGGEAEAEFTYKNPDSSPEITNITKEGRDPVQKDNALILEITYKGGNTVSIHGKDFRDGAVIKISDLLTIEEDDIIYQLPDKLTFTMPSVSEDVVGKQYRAVVINKDGGIAASDAADPPIYIQFIKGETLPQIGSVTPDKGPSTGGTKVTIEGDDFRDIMNGNDISVYFGSTKVPDEDVEVLNYKTIVVYTPAHDPGEVEVKVENPDGELSAPVGIFTYISAPKITSVVDTEKENKIYTISVEGGEKIRIKGSGFDSGSRVIFNPVLKEVEDEESPGGELVYIGERIYVLEEGVEASDVEYEDTETLDVTTPQGQIGDLTIMVINSDNGGSNIYEGLEYGLPDIAAPSNVVATLMYDKYIRVEWKAATKAFDYEVFVMIDDGGTQYIGSTDSTSITFEDLEERTDYKFLVKSVGEYGESSEYGKSNTVSTGRDVEEIEDEDGEIAEDTKIQQIGDKVEIIVGTSDYDDDNIELDLTKTEYAGIKEITIDMPAKVISSNDTRDIKIIGGEFELKFNPKIFYNTTIRENRSNENVGVRFKIDFGSGALEEDNKKLSEGYLSNTFVLEGKLFDGEKYSDIESLKAGFEIAIDFDLKKAKMRRYKRIELCRYDEYEGSWISIAARNHDYTSNIRTISDRLGKYSIIGKRQSQ